jgi:hypothetical protein
LKTTLSLITMLAIVAPVAGAQSVRATLADSSLIRQNIYKELFAGIRLSPENDARARGIIAKSEREQRGVDSLRTCGERHRRWNATTAQRDTALLATIGNAADSATFKKRAATFMVGPCPSGRP